MIVRTDRPGQVLSRQAMSGSVFVEGPLYIAAGDYDHDGQLDLAVGEPARETFFEYRRSDGTATRVPLASDQRGQATVIWSMAEQPQQLTLAALPAGQVIRGQTEFDQFGVLPTTPELDDLAERSTDHSPQRADEPYRRALSGIYARVAATARTLDHVEPVRHEIGHATPYDDPDALRADLKVLSNSLKLNGSASLAGGRLRRLLRELGGALEAFERGIGLARTCQKTLDQAEQRVQILSAKSADAELEPFADHV